MNTIVSCWNKQPCVLFLPPHLWRGRSTVTCGTRAGVLSPAGPAGTPCCKTAWRCGCKLRESLRQRPWLRRSRWPRGRRSGCGSWLRPRAPAACTPGSGWSNPMLETQWSPARRLSAGAGGLRGNRKWGKRSYSHVSLKNVTLKNITDYYIMVISVLLLLYRLITEQSNMKSTCQSVRFIFITCRLIQQWVLFPSCCLL